MVQTDNIVRLVFSLMALVGSLAQILTHVRTRFAWKRQAYAEVGPLGPWYTAIILVPLWVTFGFLIVVFLASLIAVGIGAALTAELQLPAALTRLFTLSSLLAVPYVVLAALVYFDVIPEAILAVSKHVNAIRFKVGWLNAWWQLRHHRAFFAMNLDEDRSERLAHQIFNNARTRQLTSLPYQAPTPRSLDQDQLANYLLLGCGIERRLRQLPHQGRPRLDTAWQALATVACDASHPLAPDSLRRLISSGRSVYAALRQSVPASELPDSPLVEDSVNVICRQLVRAFRGEGSRLAKGRVLRRGGSPSLLLRRLRRYDQYRESESICRLFLKLSVRMGVWPEMAPGPFLYPFNLSIGGLLLNSGVLVAAADIKTIERSDQVAAIVAEGEDHVVASVHRMFLTTANEPSTQTLTQATFGVPPRDMDQWILSDYVDLWMFGQTKDFCARRSTATPGASLGCPLKVDTNACHCDLGAARWKPSAGKLVFDKDA